MTSIKTCVINGEYNIIFKTDNPKAYMTVQELCRLYIDKEKRIPKKPTEEEKNRGIDISGEYDIDFNLCCPVCGAIVGTYESGVNEYFENYCSNCGQAIDVSYAGCEEGEENV